MMTETYHEPVMLRESIEALSIRPDGTYVDVTFGGGGHSRAILGRLGPQGRLIAFDRDASAQGNELPDKRFTLVRHNYRYLKNFLRYYEAIPVDGILADLGISSHQIDVPERGFSTRFNAPLDMRMNVESELTASEVVNTYPEEELVRIFSSYGEVFNARTLARKIAESRKETKIRETEQLKNIISQCARPGDAQYYSKVFQAIRIEVNDELESLKSMLSQAAPVLKPGGRLVVISYHSLEDRLVKNLIAHGRFEGQAERDLFGNREDVPFNSLTRKPLEPTEEEIKSNPRSRSARLRIAEKK